MKMIADEIKKLKDLLDAGTITQEEFDNQKKKIFNDESKSIPPIQPPIKKKTPKGCLVVLIVIVFFGVLVGVLASQFGDTQKSNSITSNENTVEDWLAFDERTWNDFVNIYKAHNALLDAVDAYGSGKSDSLTVYDRCIEIKDYMQKTSTIFTYGNNEEERTYLNAFTSACLSDQIAAESLIKYIDSGKMSDLSKVNENIQNAEEAITTIASNRGTLLVKAGLTDEEILEKIENDMKELEP